MIPWEGSQGLRTLRGDQYIIFDAYSSLAWQVDARLYGESHAWLKQLLIGFFHNLVHALQLGGDGAYGKGAGDVSDFLKSLLGDANGLAHLFDFLCVFDPA